ncbi:TPK-B1-binding domain-containing protein [Mycena venus]|uniref:TPK-B1-binding domain-containing protein n=1 Tax=Mycena venus TaxID=2733690 RepID=A0A8H7CBV7_9AGAR|nr:TPK-B1-binding domain-containing protein [Mycena venus]
MTTWTVEFLQPQDASESGSDRALIILNQPFSEELFYRLWTSSQWHCCADGGANRLFDILAAAQRPLFLPDLIKGDLDSIRDDVKEFYLSHVYSPSLTSAFFTKYVPSSTSLSSRIRTRTRPTLMKCVAAISDKEAHEQNEYDVVLLGGLRGNASFAVTDDNVGWVLDAGEHTIHIDHSVLGPTCGLLPVGIASTVLSTTGLRWNLSNHESSFDGLMSTSNHVLPDEGSVWIKTSNPIWWTVELRSRV